MRMHPVLFAFFILFSVILCGCAGNEDQAKDSVLVQFACWMVIGYVITALIKE